MATASVFTSEWFVSPSCRWTRVRHRALPIKVVSSLFRSHWWNIYISGSSFVNIAEPESPLIYGSGSTDS